MEVMILMTTYRQKYINNLVSTISSTSNILSFPIKINPVMRCAKKHCCNNLYFIKYTDFASSLGTSIEGAKLQLYSNDGRIMYDNSTNKTYIYYNDTHPKYRIRWNISHELGHLFCYHQFYTESKRRKLTIKEREFEAETVAWLICKRHGIYNPSEEYLASYAPQGEIPICSTDLIMKAVAEIERMMKSPIKIKESLWYKEDKGLKEKIRVIEQRQKGALIYPHSQVRFLL